MKISGIVLLFVTASLFAQNAEPVKFRSVYIGQSITHIIECSGGKAKAPKGYGTHGKICASYVTKFCNSISE
jgi:hypothetical protein